MRFEANDYKKVSGLLSILILAIFISSLTAPINTADSNAQTRANNNANPILTWYSEVIFEGGKAIDGCAIGDIYPEHEGNEVIFCSREYDLRMSYKDASGTWLKPTALLWSGLGQPLTPAIGDFDPEHEGNEIILVGMGVGMEGEGGQGEATEIYWDETINAWVQEVIFTNPNMLHGATIGDIDPRNDGDELVVVGFAYNVTLLKKAPNGTWVSELMWHDNNNVRKAV
ncbi:MAG: hypothetical protein KAJ51_07580, partial [Thermoplasmata archaeon]|nr:hypothetical protein [Thermoplasmata archaeon]